MVFGIFGKVVDNIHTKINAPAGGGQKASSGGGHAEIEHPVRIETRTHMAFLAATGGALSSRWEEKVRDYQALWKLHCDEPTELPPKNAWAYMKSCATLFEETEKWRQDVDRSFADLVKIVGEHTSGAAAIIEHKNNEISQMREDHYRKILELETKAQGDLQGMREAYEKKLAEANPKKLLADMEAKNSAAMDALRAEKDQEVENIRAQMQNKLDVLTEEKNKWHRMYLNKGKK